MDLHHTFQQNGTCIAEVFRVTALHRLVLRLLGPAYDNRYVVFAQTAE